MTKLIIERLYACSADLNAAGQYAYYGKAGGALITGNEDGVKHCTMNILYSLQHLGCSIPQRADALVTRVQSRTNSQDRMWVVHRITLKRSVSVLSGSV